MQRTCLSPAAKHCWVLNKLLRATGFRRLTEPVARLDASSSHRFRAIRYGTTSKSSVISGERRQALAEEPRPELAN
jgi:hypothetical protein